MNKILFKIIEGKGKLFLNGDLKSGEIVNPEVIPEDWLNPLLNDGETFILPEGMGFEEVTQLYYTFRDDEQMWCDENYYTKKVDLPRRKVIRLLPEKPVPNYPRTVQKEESQESLWASIINDARWYDGSPQDLRKLTIFFKSKFDTIKRK